MAISNSEYIPLYCIFLVIATFDRIKATFIRKKESNNVVLQGNKFLLFIPLYLYLVIVIASIVEFFLFVESVNVLLAVVGLGIFLSGVCLRMHAMKALGDNWSLRTVVYENHTLVNSGLYRYWKHPYYAAVIFELVGACFVANAFWSLIPVFLCQGPFLIYRAAMEEKQLESYFGSDYQDYKKGKLC